MHIKAKRPYIISTDLGCQHLIESDELFVERFIQMKKDNHH